MLSTRISFIVATFIAVCLTAAPAAAYGEHFTVTDDGILPARGAVQLLGPYRGRASDKPDDWVCVAHLGNDVAVKDPVRLLALADQAFEEYVGPACANYAFRGSTDGKWHVMPRCIIYLDEEAMTVLGLEEFKRKLIQGTITRFALRAEYRLKDDVAFTEPPKQGPTSEYVRVSQPEVPVGPSLREPNTTAVPTEIAPGVTVGLENKFDHTYYEDRKPLLIIFYRTPIPVTDIPAQRALAQKAVRAFATERLKRHELKGVSVGAFNAPKRSRFDFRSSYRYDTDEDGDMRFEN